MAKNEALIRLTKTAFEIKALKCVHELQFILGTETSVIAFFAFISRMKEEYELFFGSRTEIIGHEFILVHKLKIAHHHFYLYLSLMHKSWSLFYSSTNFRKLLWFFHE